MTGKANTGKTAKAYAHVRERLRAGDRVALLLPTHADVVRARQDLSGVGPLGLTVTTLESYILEMWESCGDGRRWVTEVQRRTLARKALGAEGGESPSGPGPVPDVCRSPGFIESLARAARDLALSGEDPSELLESRRAGSAAAKRGESAGRSEVSAGPQVMLDALARYYAELRDSALVEPGQAARRMADVAARCADDCVVVHRFTVIPPAYERLLCSLADRRDVLITLTWEEGFAATAAVDAQVGRLSELADRAGVHERLDPPDAAEGSAEIARLSRSLFADPRPRAGGGDVLFFEAASPDHEAAGVCAAVEEWLAEGMEPNEIALVYRSSVETARRVVRALESKGIACAPDLESPVSATPLGHALRGLLAFWVAGMQREDLAAFLRSPYSGLSPDEADEVVAFWRRRRLDSTPALAVSIPKGGLARHLVYEARDACAAPLTEESLEAWAGLVGGMISAARADALADATDGRRDAGTSALADDCMVQSVVLGALGEAAGLSPGTPAGEAALRVLDEARVRPRQDEAPDRVQVVSAARIRSRRFRCVAVLGLTASDFPRHRGPDEDLAGATLLAAGLEIPPMRDVAGERLLFYVVVTRARERLLLSRPLADEGGRLIGQSPFLEAVLDFYRDPSRLDEDGPMGQAAVFSPSQTVGSPAAPHASTPQAEPHPVADLHPKVSADRSEFTASEIESYLACPRKWFLERVISPSSLDEEFDALAQGSLAHAALAHVYRALPEATGSKRVDQDNLDAALEISEEFFERVEATFSGGGDGGPDGVRTPKPMTPMEIERFRKTRAMIRSVLRDDAQRYEGFEPALLEWSFDSRDDAGLEVAGAAVRGRVDRVDTDGERVLLIDYKRSKAYKHDSFASRGLVQLPLYAEVARRHLGRPLVGALYCDMSAGVTRGFFLDEHLSGAGRSSGGSKVSEEQMEAIITDALERAGRAIEGMRAGRVHPEPVHKDVCEWCSVQAWCEKATV